MTTSRVTWCRVCGAELRPTWWKRLCGFDTTLCEDAVACVVRFRVSQPPSEVGWALPTDWLHRYDGVRNRST